MVETLAGPPLTCIPGPSYTSDYSTAKPALREIDRLILFLSPQAAGKRRGWSTQTRIETGSGVFSARPTPMPTGWIEMTDHDRLNRLGHDLTAAR